MKYSILFIGLISCYSFAEAVLRVPQNTYSKSIQIINTNTQQPEIPDPTPEPTAALCSTDYLSCIQGTPLQTSINGSSLVTWSCTLDQDVKQCQKTAQSKANAGQCTDYSGQELTQQPTNLCETNYGRSTVSAGNGQYTWSCNGEEGSSTIEKGDSANCSANLIVSRKSCLTILETGGSTGDGGYALNINGQTINTYCDMTSNGGGWTLVSKYTPINPVCNYITGAACNISNLTNKSPTNSAQIDVNLVKISNEGSQYRELRAVNDSDDVVMRRPDFVFPLDLGISKGRTIQCRNINDSSWLNFSVINDSFYTNLRGLTTWNSGIDFIGYKSNFGRCGNGILYSVSDTRTAHQWIHAGYSYQPTIASQAGVFYIR